VDYYLGIDRYSCICGGFFILPALSLDVIMDIKTFWRRSLMVQTPTKPLTLEEFLALPDTKPASEYIDGQIIQKPMPQGHHSIIQLKMGIVLDTVLASPDIADTFTELRCVFGDRALVPDLSVFEISRVPTDAQGKIENAFLIAPDWTIEILSPGQSATKVLKKINHCLDYGTQMGWLIDPESESITISRASQNILIIDEPNTILPVPEFAKSIQLTVADIFGWLKRSPKTTT
jgi:Uma2 family endonuclease